MLLGRLDAVLSPDPLHALAMMGHGDRLALVDANYPATRALQAVLRRAWSFATRTVAVSAAKPPVVRRPTA
jgi:L-fucose mutarotase/ribose pyranase (RbsD/FucU family)